MSNTQPKPDSYRHQLRSTFYVFLILALVIFSVEAMSAETASILPKGISRFRVVGIQTSTITERLNSNGNRESITAGLSRRVTSLDIASSNTPEGKMLKPLVETLQNVDGAKGTNYASTLMVANLSADFDIRATQVMPSYEYGLSENLNLGIRIPVVHRSARANFRSTFANNSAAHAEATKNIDPRLTEGLNVASNVNVTTASFENALFISKGYDAPRDFQNTALGDIEVGTKYRFHKTDYMTSSLQTGLRMPTGSRASRTNIFDSGTGNGTWATGAYLFNDFYPTSRWTIGTSFKTIYNLPDRFAAAVPRDANDALPSNLPQDGQVQSVSRTSGLEYNGELSSTVRLFNNSITPWVAYQWAQHGIDKYRGPGSLYYSGLEDGTDFTRHALELGAGYTTVPAFAAKKASIPYTIEALYNRTLAGRNTSFASYVRIDLISYF